MLIILDLGANDGCSILKFKDILKKRNIENYKIYSFEPNPYFKNNLFKQENENVKIFMKIAGTRNSLTKLYLSQNNDKGSTIYNDKTSNDINKKIYLNCPEIDIASFIKQIKGDNELWVKMDVEGAEYKIIPHLYEQDCINMINKLYIEWHYDKIPSISEEFHYKVFNMVKNIEMHNWCAISYSNIYNYNYKQFLKIVKNKLKNKENN
mgnify:CR=1 FL=1